MPAILQSALYALRPLETSRSWWRQFGDVYTIRLLPTGPFVHVADPEAAQRIFKADSCFHGGSANERMLGQVSGPSSILLLEEKEHEHTRQLLQPLLRSTAVASHKAMIERIVEDNLVAWPVGKPFALAPRMERIALEVGVRAIVADDDQLAAELKHILPKLLLLNSWAWMPGLRHDLGPFSPVGRLRIYLRKFDEVLYTAMEQRRTHGASDEETTLDGLLATRDGDSPLEDKTIRDQILTLLLVGYQTTAGALTWTFERLLRHPGAINRVRAERNRNEDRYLEAAIKEALRCRPPVMEIGRNAKYEYSAGGTTCPAKSLARIAISDIHHRPDLFPEPDEYRPERFLSGEASGRHWIPFGGGSRRCLGASLAMLELKTVVASVLERAELRPASRRREGSAIKPPRLTTIPARGCRVVLEGLCDGRRPNSAMRSSMPSESAHG